MDLVVKALLEQYVADTMIGAGAIKGDKGDKGDTGDQGIQGEKGDKGDAATIAVGTVTAGESMSVTNSGTQNDAILDFVLEKGEKGDKGDTGITAQIFTGTEITGDTDAVVYVETSNVGDLYINTDTSNVYKRTDKLSTTNLWEKVGNIKGDEGDDAYEVAVAEGFIGTRAEWLESLHGEATGSFIVWEKPNLNDDDTSLHTWYYYKIDTSEYGSGSAWLNRFNIPNTQDYPAGDYAFFNGLSYLCFSCDTDIPALTQKDTTSFYVLYDEKNQKCQARIVDIATGQEISLNWTDVTVSSTLLDGYTEVTPEGGAIQYGKWVQTIYLGSSKTSAYDCTISTGTSVSGFITTEAFAQTIGSLGLLTTTTKENVVGAINEVNTKFDDYVAKTDIVDGLTSEYTNKPLSAKQGKVLNDTLETHTSDTDIHVSTTDKESWLPTGSVIPFAGSNAPNGYLMCNGSVVSRTDYSDLFDVIGTTYGEGDGSTTFNLPNLQDKFIQGASGTNAVGTVKEAGLPNITGSLNMPASVGRSGALYYTTYSGGSETFDISGSKTSNAVGFNASLSNSIYGNSDTVQPPALVMNYIIKY